MSSITETFIKISQVIRKRSLKKRSNLKLLLATVLDSVWRSLEVLLTQESLQFNLNPPVDLLWSSLIFSFPLNLSAPLLNLPSPLQKRLSLAFSTLSLHSRSNFIYTLQRYSNFIEAWYSLSHSRLYMVFFAEIYNFWCITPKRDE
jgi:hypothetical protein